MDQMATRKKQVLENDIHFAIKGIVTKIWGILPDIGQYWGKFSTSISWTGYKLFNQKLFIHLKRNFRLKLLILEANSEFVNL
jgi:hypothetical protein